MSDSLIEPLRRELNLLPQRARRTVARNRTGRFISRLLGGALSVAVPGLAWLAGTTTPPATNDPTENPEIQQPADVESAIARALVKHDATHPHGTTLVFRNADGLEPADGGPDATISLATINALIDERLRNLPAGVAPVINVHQSPTNSVVNLAATSQNWYRTRLSAGDYFWALPDAGFTLSAQNISACSGASTCNAQIDIRSTQFKGTKTPTMLATIKRGTFQRENAVSNCAVVLDNVWSCAFEATTAVAAEADNDKDDLCLWLKLPKLQPDPSDDDTVTFDVLWLRDEFESGNPDCSSLTGGLNL